MAMLFIFHGLAEFIGVDVAAKCFKASLSIFCQQRRPGEPDEHCVGHHRLHNAMQLAALRAMALVHEHKDLANCPAGLSR